MSIKSKLAIAASAVVLGAGLAMSTSLTAHATTGTCTANPVPVGAEPVGCGGVYLPLDGSGIQPNSSSLTLTATSDFWNAGVTVAPYNNTDASQDFTVYQACDFNNPGPFNGGVPILPTHLNPCGKNGTPVLNPDGFKEFVAEVTPDGAHLGGAVNSPSNLCLSVEGVADGPVHNGHHALRWHVVLRTCDTYGAVFTSGKGDGTTTGVAGVVNLANHWQTWSPIPANGGYVLANNALSGNEFNHPFVLDKRGGGLSPGPVIAFPENDQANEIWKVIGCTSPVTDLTPGFFSCP